MSIRTYRILSLVNIGIPLFASALYFVAFLIPCFGECIATFFIQILVAGVALLAWVMLSLSLAIISFLKGLGSKGFPLPWGSLLIQAFIVVSLGVIYIH
jgi:hypothetical protein